MRVGSAGSAPLPEPEELPVDRGGSREVEPEPEPEHLASGPVHKGSPAQGVYGLARDDHAALGSPLLGRFLGRSRDELLVVPGLDGVTADLLLGAIARGGVDHWGDVERLLGEALGPDGAALVLRGIYRLEALAHVQAAGLQPGSSVLFLASEPRDAGPLDLTTESERVAASAERHVTVVAEPTLGEIEALAATGAFRGVWVAGHGEAGRLLLSDHDRQRLDVDAEAFAKAVSASPAVEFVMASVCHGASGGDQSVLRVVAAHGPQTAGYAGPVSDDEAIAVSSIVARALARGASFRAAVAAAYYTVFPDDGMLRGWRDGLRNADRSGTGAHPTAADREARRQVGGGPPPEWHPFVQLELGERKVSDPPESPR